MRKETPVEEPEPDPLKTGSICVCGEVCYREGDAQRRARRAVPPPGSRYQALPCKQLREWWHVYLRTPDKLPGKVRRQREAYDRELRRRLEEQDR